MALVRPQRAEEFYRQAIAFDPASSDAYLHLGDVLRAQGKNENAARAYIKALEFKERLPEAHYQLGILYESHLNDSQKAMAHYRAYLQLAGTDQRVKIWLRNLVRREQQTVTP